MSNNIFARHRVTNQLDKFLVDNSANYFVATKIHMSFDNYFEYLAFIAEYMKSDQYDPVVEINVNEYLGLQVVYDPELEDFDMVLRFDEDSIIGRSYE